MIVRLEGPVGRLCTDILDSDGSSFRIMTASEAMLEDQSQYKGMDELLLHIGCTNATTEPDELRTILCTPGFLTLSKAESPVQIEILRRLFCE
jgi:hypothetical protein